MAGDAGRQRKRLLARFTPLGYRRLLAVSSAADVIEYPIGASGQTLRFGDVVLGHFWRHRQRRFWTPEAGGQLFGRFEGRVITVTYATGPRRRDVRTPWSYEPCREEEQAEIDEMHRANFLFFGDWHTHLQPRPRPSEQDRQNVSDIVRKTRHGLNGLLMVIVGTTQAPSGLYVCISDGAELYDLVPR
jgi:integrative and conjugative element protein (TIGR02256 family)